jgi:hypothetical protein
LQNWKEYKQSVPTYGAIILNEDLTQVHSRQDIIAFWRRCTGVSAL